MKVFVQFVTIEDLRYPTSIENKRLRDEMVFRSQRNADTFDRYSQLAFVIGKCGVVGSHLDHKVSGTRGGVVTEVRRIRWRELRDNVYGKNLSSRREVKEEQAEG